MKKNFFNLYYGKIDRYGGGDVGILLKEEVKYNDIIQTIEERYGEMAEGWASVHPGDLLQVVAVPVGGEEGNEEGGEVVAVLKILKNRFKFFASFQEKKEEISNFIFGDFKKYYKINILNPDQDFKKNHVLIEKKELSIFFNEDFKSESEENEAFYIKIEAAEEMGIF